MSAYYTFLPWLRQGLVNAINPTTDADNMASTSPSTAGTDRPLLAVEMTLVKKDRAGSTTTETLNALPSAALVGPGDVLGINTNNIVKVSPADGVKNFEPNYLPYIEFYEEDFPWRYTPATPVSGSTPTPPTSQSAHKNIRLRPWITLIALEDDEFDEVTFNGVCQQILIKASAGKPWTDILPDEHQVWAWAHVQMAWDPTSNMSDSNLAGKVTSIDSEIRANPDKSLSRIICPRRLRPDTTYHMFLIPTFEVGRLAGSGLPTTGIKGQNPAWQVGNTSVTQIQMPYYYRWSFVTGSAGDFESLVSRLQPKVLDQLVGKRPIDVQLPGAPVDLESPLPQLYLQGVLKPANSTFTPESWPIGNSSTENNFVKKLRTFLNEQDSNLASPVVNSNPIYYTDPVITAPTYGKWHMMKRKLQVPGSFFTPTWIDKANLDPRYRIFAGTGAEIFRKFQEQYMNLAWQQIDEVNEVNKLILPMKAMLEAMWVAYYKNLETQVPEKVISYVTPLHANIIRSSSDTLYKEVEDSCVPAGCYTAAFNRMNRGGGPVARAVAAATSSQPLQAYEVAAAFNSGSVTAAPQLNNPSGPVLASASFAATQTSSYAFSMAPVTNFALTSPGSSFSPASGPYNSTPATYAINAIANFNNAAATVNNYTPPNKPSLNYSAIKTTVLQELDPRSNYVSYVVDDRVQVTSHSSTPPPPPVFDYVLAAPVISEPMYKKLAEHSLDFFMPGLNTIPDESITLLKVNQSMVEAFMLGLNFEMNRELLWREYPTDLRGTFFEQFWGPNNHPTPNAADQKDIKKIHLWRNTTTNVLNDIGRNSARTADPDNLLVLCVRGELLRKYPNTFIYAQQAKWAKKADNVTDDYGKARELDPGGTIKWPIFAASLNPDIFFIGFDLNLADAKGTEFSLDPAHPLDPLYDVANNPSDKGYYFVFEERLGETRFGLDVLSPGTLPKTSATDWDDVEWGHFLSNANAYGQLNTNQSFTVTNNADNVFWGANAADVAYTTFQKPMRICVHAHELLKGL